MSNLLYLVHRLPYPPNKGDKVRSFHLLKHLAARHRVFLGTFIDDPADEAHVGTLGDYCAGMHVARLSPESRYRRFFSPMPRLTDAMVRRLVGTDGHDHVALVAETLPARNEHPVPLGVARFIRVNGRPSAAEVAVTVIDEMHGRGLGHLLLEAIAALAREHGVTMIVASVLAENAPMNALIRSMGRVASLRRDQGVLLYEVPLRH